MGMRKGIGRIFCFLFAALLLSGQYAWAEPYTVPKQLQEVSGLPDNPEAPSMKTRTKDGTVTVAIDGDLLALNVNWRNFRFPLTLQGGEASFTMDREMIRMGVGKKQSGVTWTLYDASGDSREYGISGMNGETGGMLTCEVRPYDTEIMMPGFAILRKAASDNEYDYYEAEYAKVRKPGYYYWVPTEVQVLFSEILETDGEGNPVRVKETQEITCEQRTIESSDRKANRETVRILQQEMREAAERLHVEPDLNDWELDTKGCVEIRLRPAVNRALASTLKATDYAFEGTLPGGALVRYNRIGDCCEKEYTLEGVDFFDSETTPSRVTVTWNKGRNMYNKIIWYVSAITQSYGDKAVTGRYSQGGKLINTVTE